jgi:hypothetical protein
MLGRVKTKRVRMILPQISKGVTMQSNIDGQRFACRGTTHGGRGKDGSGSGSGWISAGSGLVMISHPWFSGLGSGSGLVSDSGSVSGLVFHPCISNGYPK